MGENKLTGEGDCAGCGHPKTLHAVRTGRCMVGAGGQLQQVESCGCVLYEGAALDAAVMARLRAPFGCEFIARAVAPTGGLGGRWRIHDANDDAIASVSGLEEGYARLIVSALNDRAELRATITTLAIMIELMLAKPPAEGLEQDAVRAVVDTAKNLLARMGG